MCAGSEFQVDGAETGNAREVKILVIPPDTDRAVPRILLRRGFKNSERGEARSKGPKPEA